MSSLFLISTHIARAAAPQGRASIHFRYFGSADGPRTGRPPPPGARVVYGQAPAPPPPSPTLSSPSWYKKYNVRARAGIPVPRPTDRASRCTHYSLRRRGRRAAVYTAGKMFFFFVVRVLRSHNALHRALYQRTHKQHARTPHVAAHSIAPLVQRPALQRAAPVLHRVSVDGAIIVV